ncbi:hypothetical protein IF2G_05679 [Cordyceps javanica]|nr:hypothetical protein IF2G_05679 [Cordyceps javanica]
MFATDREPAASQAGGVTETGGKGERERERTCPLAAEYLALAKGPALAAGTAETVAAGRQGPGASRVAGVEEVLFESPKAAAAGELAGRALPGHGGRGGEDGKQQHGFPAGKHGVAMRAGVVKRAVNDGGRVLVVLFGRVEDGKFALV